MPKTPWGGRKAQALTAECLATKGRTCHLCLQPGATTADHVIPRELGGLDVLENLEPAHFSCNSARGARTMAEWWATHPRPARPALALSSRWAAR